MSLKLEEWIRNLQQLSSSTVVVAYVEWKWGKMMSIDCDTTNNVEQKEKHPSASRYI